MKGGHGACRVRFRAIVGAAPLKLIAAQHFAIDRTRFRAIVGAAPLKLGQNEAGRILPHRFPRHCWRGSIEASLPWWTWCPKLGFRAIVGAAPLKLNSRRPISIRSAARFRAIVGAAPVKRGIAEKACSGLREFPRHCWRGSIEARFGAYPQIASPVFPRHCCAAPLKHDLPLTQPAPEECFRAIVGAAPLKLIHTRRSRRGQRFPRHCWRGSIEALEQIKPFQTQPRFRAIVGAAPLKRGSSVAMVRRSYGFRAIVGAAPLKQTGRQRWQPFRKVSAPLLARLH